MKNKKIEVQSPTIPKLVADYIDWSKKQLDFTLRDLINFQTLPVKGKPYQVKAIEELSNFVLSNTEIMAKAWLYGYKLQKRNYIEIKMEEDWGVDPVLELGVPIRFIGERPDIYESFKFLYELFKIETGEEITLEIALNNTFSNNDKKDILEEFVTFYPDFEDELTSFEDASKIMPEELFEFSITDTKDIEKMMNGNNFQMGTVGRSQWTHYIMHDKYTDYNLPFDMWEGNNLYTISLLDTNEYGKFIGYKDSVHFIYAPNTDDIFQAISDHFGLTIEDIYLTNNEITQHLLNVNKIIERTEVYYEPEALSQ